LRCWMQAKVGQGRTSTESMKIPGIKYTGRFKRHKGMVSCNHLVWNLFNTK
jgi:hypothetical protein